MTAGVRGSLVADYRAASAAQKPPANVPWYMREVNRRLGRALAVAFARTRVRPDQVTLLGFACFVLGAVALLTLPGALAPATTVLLWQAAFALDAADGQLARLTGASSPAGEWLDHVLDAARMLLVHVVLAAAWVLDDQPHGTTVVVLAVLFAVSAQVRFFAQILAEQLEARAASAGRHAGPRTARPGPTPPPASRAWVQLPTDTGVINLSVLLWIWPPAFVVGYGALAAAHVLLLGATLLRRHRALR